MQPHNFSWNWPRNGHYSCLDIGQVQIYTLWYTSTDLEIDTHSHKIKQFNQMANKQRKWPKILALHWYKLKTFSLYEYVYLSIWVYNCVFLYWTYVLDSTRQAIEKGLSGRMSPSTVPHTLGLFKEIFHATPSLTEIVFTYYCILQKQPSFSFHHPFLFIVRDWFMRNS